MATIQLKRSNTAGANPTTSNLALGELGINTKDGKFFLRKHVDGNTSGDTILTYAPQGINPFGTQTYVTKVVSKTAAHPYNGSGSSSGYTIDGLESPYLLLVPGNTYKFDQADSSNSGHPLRFYLEADKTTAYTTGVTTNGTPGTSGAYTQIVVATTTPQVLYYQCSAHAYMGSASYSVSDAIADGKVGTAQIATNAVTSTKIAQNSILTKHIDDNQVTADQIADATITTTQIAANTIATGNIADNAVDGTKIAQNSILTRHIDDNQVTADQIADATITTTQIAANTIATANVADNAIDGTKIASNSILTRHIDDNQIGIDQLNVTDGSNGQVLKTDGSGTLSFGTVTSGGSASNSFETIAIAGQSNVVADSSTDTLTLVGGTGITLTTNATSDTITITGTTGISANAVDATHIATGAVGASELAATTVTAGSYTNTDLTVDADGRITAASNGTAVIADGAITTAKLADDAVTADKLADTAVSAGTYGSTTVSPQITVDAQGRITNVSNQTISGGSGGSGGIGLNQTVAVYEASGDGSTTAFNTGSTINAESLTWVFVDGVYQEKGTYSTSGSTVTFSTAPPNGTSVEINNLSNVTTGGAFNHNSYSGDGSTTAFTLSKAPGSDTDLIVFIDGVYQNADAFNVSGTTLTFDTAPVNGTKVIAYTIGGVVMGKTMVVDTLDGDGSTTAFTLSMDPIQEENTQVYVGGVYQPKGTYSLSGTTLTFSEAPPSATGNIEVNISQVTTLTEVGANSVTATSIAANAVGSAEIAANSVDSSELVTGSIDTIHIGDDQVTNAKLAVNSVSAVELAGNSVTSTQIAANQVGVSELNLSEGTSGQVLTTDGSGTLSFSTVAGTTINNNADNRIITGSGTANTLNGEANFVFDGTSLGVGLSSPQAGLDLGSSAKGTWSSGNVYSYPTGNAYIKIQGTSAEHNWIGIAGAYGATSGSANLMLQANLNNTSQQAGSYIGSEAQSATTADITFGKLVGGSTTSTNATKSEFMRIDSSGNVGINRASPNGLLHMQSNSGTDSALYIQTSATSDDSIINFGDNGSSAVGKILYQHSSDSMQFNTQSSERMRIAGNNLHLNGGTDARIQLGTGGAGANQVSNNTVHIRGDGADMKLMAASGGIYQFEQNGTERMRIDSSGNVGIGQISPATTLHIGDGASHYVRIENAGSGDVSSGYQIYRGSSVGMMLYDNPADNATSLIAAGRFNIITGGSGIDFIIDTDGRVGINRTPAISNSKLEVGGADNVPLINVEASGTTGGIGVGSSKVQIYHGTSAKLFLTSDGSLGINESVPTGKLHVRDNNFAGYMGIFSQGGTGGANHGMYIETGASSSYLMIQRVSGTTMHYVVGNGNYYFAGTAQSDFNKKENILDISNGLDVVNNLRPRTFNFKDNSSVDKAGFIAQEAQIVEPRLVSGNEFDETQTDEEGSNPTGLGFDYMGYTAYLTKAIQEQQALIESLTTRLETLENA